MTSAPRSARIMLANATGLNLDISTTRMSSRTLGLACGDPAPVTSCAPGKADALVPGARVGSLDHRGRLAHMPDDAVDLSILGGRAFEPAQAERLHGVDD